MTRESGVIKVRPADTGWIIWSPTCITGAFVERSKFIPLIKSIIEAGEEMLVAFHKPTQRTDKLKKIKIFTVSFGTTKRANMIKGIYETHINVENLERSIDFYKNVLGLAQCYHSDTRKIAFFWVGEPREFMLGLWEKPKNEVVKMHFAFRCDKEDILNKSVKFLKSRKLKPYNFLNDEREIPLVFAWMPAIAIYFDDPDGHCLEFISILDGEPNAELGIITYEEWKKYLEEKEGANRVSKKGD